MIFRRAHAVTAGAVVVIGGAALLAVGSNASVWESWRAASCMPDRCFCEAIRPQLVKQPANAVSGLAFAGVGILVLLSGLRDPTKRASAVHPVIYASASLLIGIGTVFYHSSLTFWGQTADVLGMYLIATFLVLYNASRLRPISPLAAGTIYVAANLALLGALIMVPGARRYAFGALILLALLLDLAARRRERAGTNARLFKIAVGVLALGFLIWVIDLTRVMCSPDSWLQGHAIWHIAGAVSLWLVFVHYKLQPATAN